MNATKRQHEASFWWQRNHYFYRMHRRLMQHSLIKTRKYTVTLRSLNWVPSKRQKKPQPTMPQLIMLQHLTLLRMSLFGVAHGWGVKAPISSLKSVTHILQWYNLAQVSLTKGRSKKHINHVTHHLSPADISIFPRRTSASFEISQNTDIDCFLARNFYLILFFFFLSLKGLF